MKKFNDFTNESIRDKMTPVSEEDIKNKMGEEKYKIYKEYDNILNLKAPFDINQPHYFEMFNENKNKIYVYFWFVRFEISYNRKWTCIHHYNDTNEVNIFDNWDDVYNQMKKDIKKIFKKETKILVKEIKKYQKKIDYMNKDLEKLD